MGLFGLGSLGQKDVSSPVAEAPSTSNQTSPQQNPWTNGGFFPNQNGSSTPASLADAKESTGVVLLNVTVDWGLGEAAGTGLVIDPSGDVVTNHHVVAGSTAIIATDPATGKTYDASVVGYDASDDVAVIKLAGASGLATITPITTVPRVGASITAVGNAEGAGQLTAASGQVRDTGASITVTDDFGSQEYLTNLVEMSANIVPGDSGGAVLNALNQTIAMNVAGSEDSRVVDTYAIPMSTVLADAVAIVDGPASSTITLGRTAGLGVTVDDSFVVNGVVRGGAADQVGITVGSTITGMDGQAIRSQQDLATILAGLKPQDKVAVKWTDEAGTAHQATVTLQEAPLA